MRSQDSTPSKRARRLGVTVGVGVGAAAVTLAAISHPHGPSEAAPEKAVCAVPLRGDVSSIAAAKDIVRSADSNYRGSVALYDSTTKQVIENPGPTNQHGGDIIVAKDITQQACTALGSEALFGSQVQIQQQEGIDLSQ